MKDSITLFAQKITNSDVPGLPKMKADDLLANGLSLTYMLVGIIAVITIISAGIMYITAAGDSGKVAKAKNLLIYAIVGIVIAALAFVITGIVRGAMS